MEDLYVKVARWEIDEGDAILRSWYVDNGRRLDEASDFGGATLTG
jgi:hypothetical protein